MKTYTQDYTKITEAEELLYSATRLMANDCNDASLERINEARTLLQEYTNGTNLVEDVDVADGLVKQSDAEEILSKLSDIYRRLHNAEEWTDVDDVEKSLRTLIQGVRGDTQ